MTTNPNSTPRKYNDLILRPEFRRFHLNFPHGSTWIRILPGLSNSSYGWLLPTYAHEFPGGRFLHPKSINPNKRSTFEIAHEWFLIHKPHLLQSKINKQGFRLLPKKLCAFWAIEHSTNGNHSLKLVLESFSDSTRSPVGLAREIWRKIFQKDENESLMIDALDPTSGVMICVERHKRKIPHPPLDWVRAGQIPHSVDQMLEKINRVDFSALCPLEHVVYEPTAQEQWEYLGRLISPELVNHIRRRHH